MTDADRTTALADALIDRATRRVAERGDDRVPRVVEVGIGERTAIATALAERGAVVLATDVVVRSVPEQIDFRQDDVLDPEQELYREADLCYALRLPPELHGALADVAGDLDVPAAFTTLGGDPPTVPTRPEQLPGGETLHWIERGP